MFHQTAASDTPAYNLQGGAITAAFAASHPHLVNGKVALIAPVGLMQVGSEVEAGTRPR
jgi:hypothetical protein